MTQQQQQLTPLEVLRLYPPHDGSLLSMLRSRVAAAPDREFVHYEGRSWSYAQVQQPVARCMAVLRQQGVAAGDRGAVMSPNDPVTVFLMLALAALGAILVPVNPNYGTDEAHYVLDHAGVCGVVAAPANLPTVQAACGTIRPAPWCLLTTAPAVGQGAAPVLPVLPERMAAVEPAALPEGARADEVCVFIYTSGTTGFPKAVMHTQRSVVLAGEGFVDRMWLQPDDRLLCVLPMFHINAICYSFLGALAAGATLILEPRFSASAFWQVVQRTGATEVNTIAAASSVLLRRPRSEFVPGHRLRKVYGAPFDALTYQVFQQEFGVPTLIEGYGMSEIPGALSNPFPGPHKVGSMGRPSRHPDPGIRLAELRITDDDGRELPVGEVGELVVRTPLAMRGYYRDAGQTAAAFRDGWFLTGDLARVDEDGYFWFVARKKDIIRKRGENISGAELDRVIGEHPDVVEAAAIAVPSDLGEDDILVAVVLRPGAAPEHEDIARWCRTRLAAYKVPRYVAFVAELPHTPTHRVAKFRLRGDKALLAAACDLEGGAPR